jgi:hypothetical protein
LFTREGRLSRRSQTSKGRNPSEAHEATNVQRMPEHNGKPKRRL